MYVHQATPIPFKVDIQKCARCGNDHYSMEIKNLSFKIEEFDKFFTCPFESKPVLIKVIQA
jgi:hypothetical protein